MLYINFPKKGVVQTFLRGRSNAGFAGGWAGRELTFGRHLFSENWRRKISGSKGTNKKIFSREIKYHFQLLKGHKQKGKIEREKGWKKRSLVVSWKGTKRDFQGRLNTGSMPIEKFVFVFGKLNECKISDWKKQMPWWKVWEFFLSSRLNHNQAASKCHVEKKKMQI